jgi:hypothetical protein
VISAVPLGSRLARAAPPLLALALLASGCVAPDPQAEMEVSGLEAYWAVDSPVGQAQYIAPAVRFVVRNKGTKPHRSVQATATFKRKGEAETWSSAWQVVSPVGGKPLAPGETRLVALKPEAEGRYHSTGSPESMFQHPQFKDVHVDLFLRVGNSAWSKFAAVDVERRIGPHGAGPAEP